MTQFDKDIFVFKFMSKSAGFGIRESNNQEKKTTEHIINVVVQNNEVIQAIIDNKWNEIKQREILDYEMIDGEKVDKIPIYYCTEPRPKNCEKEKESVSSVRIKSTLTINQRLYSND